MSLQMGNVHFFQIKPMLKIGCFDSYCDNYELQHFINECTKYYIRKSGLQPNLAFNEFIQIYFKGETILLKPFNQFCASKMNRVVFVYNFQKIFDQFEDKSGFDYLQLLKLVCSDFPKETVLKALKCYGNGDEEQLLKKQLSLIQVCKALLFELLFEEFLTAIQDQVKVDCNIEAVVPIVRKFYPSNEEFPLMPNQAAVFECLLKFSSEKYKGAPLPIMPYKQEMLTTLINGEVDYTQFNISLFQNSKIDQQLNRLLHMIDKSNNRIAEISRLQNEDEDLRRKIRK